WLSRFDGGQRSVGLGSLERVEMVLIGSGLYAVQKGMEWREVSLFEPCTQSDKVDSFLFALNRR
ncbi:MAG: hypothetical protein B0D91_11160, partial [Oceanospirillales bacterium LUC14_002_19_P2]